MNWFSMSNSYSGVPSFVGESSRPDILYLVHRLPYPPDKGDRIRTFHLLRSLSKRAAVARLRGLGRGLPDGAGAVPLVGEAEAALSRRFRPGAGVHTITNGVDLDAFRPDPSAVEQGCVFVGAFDYRPNVDGACWFCQ